MMNKRLTIIFLIFTCANLCILSITESRTIDEREFIYENRSFTLRSTITGLDDVGFLQSVYIIESYSHEQQRAKIKYRNSNTIDGSKWFYYDAKTHASLIFKNENKVCSEGTFKDMFLSFLGKNSETLLDVLVSMSTREDTEKFNYLIGPAKLLQLVLSKAESMRVIYWPEAQKTSTIRNHDVIEYALYTNVNNQSLQLKVFYDKVTFSADRMSKTVPLQVQVKLPQFKRSILIDYYEHQYIWSLDYPVDRGLDINSRVLLDEFTFPTAYNCSRKLEKQLDIFNGYDVGAMRFSFTAQSSWSLRNYESENFVAYDGVLQSMRIDDKKRSLVKSYKDTITFTDFRSGRMYTIFNNEDRCFVMQSLESVIKSERLTFSKILLGTDNQPTYMGRAQVRGQSALVFEVYSQQLPYWFSQPRPIKLYKNGQIVGRHLGSFLTSLRFPPNEYNILVYISWENQESYSGLKLLLVEVFDLYQAIRKPIFSAHFYDFQYELNEAPNNDKGMEIFSLKDRCSSSIDDDRYAEVDLLLEKDAGEGETPAWLNNWVDRDYALLSGFRDVLSLPSSFVYGLESRILTNQNSTYISAKFRVAEHPMYFHRIYFMGNADLIGSTRGLISLQAQTPVECFLLLNTEPQSIDPVYLYFHDEAQRCLVNRNMISGNLTGSAVDLTKLQDIFNMKRASVGEIFKFEPAQDMGAAIAFSWLRSDNFEHLTDRLVYLQKVESQNIDQPINPQQMRLRIRKAHLKSVNYMSRVGTQQKEAIKFTRFGLIRSVGVKEVQNIENFQQCEAACIADLECRTYSFCVRSGKLECLLSSSSIQKSYLLRLEQLQNKSGKNSINLTENGTLELVRDLRCELRAKLYLELFKITLPAIHTLRSYHEIIPVSSREDCAEICFARNLESLKVGALVGNGQVQFDKLNEMPKKQSTYFSSFCDKFKYVDSTLTEKQETVLKNLVDTEKIDSQFCVLDKQTKLSFENASQDESTELAFKFEVYEFDFTTLYERKEGFRLVESPFSNDEKKALQILSENHGENVDPKQLELLKKELNYDGSSKNYQYRLKSKLSVCAGLCFTQKANLWPACRSFDYSHYSMDNYFGIESTCTLNTASLATLDKSLQEKLISRTPDKSNFHTWHYGPRFGLIEKRLANDYLLGLNITVTEKENAWHFGGLLISLLALLSSYVVSMKALELIKKKDNSVNLSMKNYSQFSQRN